MTDYEIYELVEELSKETERHIKKTTQRNLSKRGEGETVHRIARALDVAHKRGELFALQKVMEIIASEH